jgi:hypothetical protein
MKKIVMIMSLAIASIGFSYAQVETEDNRYQEGQRVQEPLIDGEFKNDVKSDIELEQLPANIHQDLNVGDFSDWEIEDAYRIDDAHIRESGVAYEVIIARRGVKKALHYDEQGKFISTKENPKKN